MPRWNIITTVAGVDFSLCRALILDGARFSTQYKGSVLSAADGTPHPQRANVGVKGIAFGVSMPNASKALILSANTAIQTAEAGGLTFPVHLKDALNDINVDAIPDYNVEWFTHGPESEDIIDNVIYRFIAMALIL